MRLGAAVDRSTLVGAVAVTLWDAVFDRPLPVACTITALRESDLRPIKRASAHPAGVYGFLELRPGRYRLLIEPAGLFVPSVRTIDVPAQPAKAVKVTARLRPSPSFPAARGCIVLRGTLWWKTASPVPVRRAAVFGALSATAAPGVELASAWTRADDNGDFALVLPSPAPGSDGTPVPYTATVDIRTAASQPSSLAPDDVADMPLDDGTETDVGGREPVRRTITVAVDRGAELSLNSDPYTPPTRPFASTVIWLNPT